VDVSDFTMDTGDSLNADACAAAFQQLGADLFAVTAGMLGIIATLSACLGAYIAGKRFIIPVVPALLEVPCDAALAIFEAAEAVAVQAALNDIAQIASGIC
jgi:Na+/serine symporter